MRKGIKIVFRVLGLVVIFCLLAIVALPLLLKDQLIETVRRAADNQIEGAFYFEDAEVGILRTFPNLCIKLKAPVLTGAEHPEGDNLFTAETVDIVVDIMSLIKRNRPVKVVGVSMEKPDISIYFGPDGITNFDLTAPSDQADTTSGGTDSLIVEIDDYRITDGRLKYLDPANAMRLTLEHFDHSGKLRYEDEQIDLSTSTGGGQITIIYDGIAYLSGVEITGRNDLHIDLAQSVYSLVDNSLTLNALALEAAGTIALSDDATDFDLSFSGEKNAFKNLLSLLPNMYSEEFDAMQASGSLTASGSLKGRLTETETPVYRISLKVDDGAFQYPGKPLGFRQIFVNGDLHNQNGNWDPVEINLTSLKFLLNQQPFDARIHIAQPTAKASYKGLMKGMIDLADFNNAYPLDEIEDLKGKLTADVTFDIAPNRTPGAQIVAGSLVGSDIFARSQDQDIAVKTVLIDFDPGMVKVQTQAAIWNGSPALIDMTFRNPVGWLTENQIMDVDGQLSLVKLDMNKYMEPETTVTAQSSPAASGAGLETVRYSGAVEIDTLIYEDYLITDGKTRVQGTLSELRLSQMQGQINGTSFTADATFTQVGDYLDGSSPLKGSMDCRLDKVFVNRWIAGEDAVPSASDSAEQYLMLPGDISLDITFRADEAQYEHIVIRAPRGTLALHDRMLEVLDFKGEAMGGTMAFSGLYNTQSAGNPAFNLKYDLSSLSFQEAFQEVETFRALAPVVQYIKGVFNSTLVMEGRLGKSYLPDLKTLSASGFLETLNGSVDQVGLIEKLSQFLNLKKPLRVDLGQTRNWFEVKDGYVLTQEMTKTFDDIEMAFGGKHQIKGEMDYLIKLNIPEDRITSNPVGTLAKSGYEQLQKKASEYGVKLNTIERFIVHVHVTGRLGDPQFSMKFFDASGKTLKDVAAEELSGIKAQAKDTLTALGNQALGQAKDTLKGKLDVAADSARAIAEQKIAEAGKSLLNEATGRLDSTLRDSLTSGILDKVGTGAKDVLGEKPRDEVDKIKNALDKWDPLKKKKKE